MSLKPTLEEQELLAETIRRVETRMPRRELLSELGIGLAFVAATALIWMLAPPRGFALGTAAICFAVLVLATRVRFDTPFGYTVATELAFVPLVFALPIAFVPAVVLAALVAAQLPEVLRGRSPARRLWLTVGNAWFAIGPVAVFAVAGTSPRHAGPGLLIAALAAQLIVDFGVSSWRFSFARGVNLSSHLRDAWVYGIDAALAGIGLLVAEDIHHTPIAALAPLPLLALLASFARERHQAMHNLVELNSAYRGTALVLGDVIEADDGYTGEHCKGVVRLALAMGQKLGLDAEHTRNLEFGALLHDIGKIAIPKEIINKPGKLDPDEWELMKTHTVRGQEMLDRIGGFMNSVGLVVRSHHERWDGRGYPDGLAGEAIPLEARIIVCCDSWNAMRTDRSYRQALSYEVAREEMLSNAGRQFDPQLVPVLLAVIEDTPEDPQPEWSVAQLELERVGTAIYAAASNSSSSSGASMAGASTEP